MNYTFVYMIIYVYNHIISYIYMYKYIYIHTVIIHHIHHIIPDHLICLKHVGLICTIKILNVIYVYIYNYVYIYIYKIILCCILHIIYHVSLFHHTLPYGCVASFPNWGGLQNDNLNEEMMLPLDAGVSQPGNLELSARKMVLSPPRTWFWPSKLQIFPLQMFQLRDAELSSTGHDTSGIGPVRWPHKRWKKLITR